MSAGRAEPIERHTYGAAGSAIPADVGAEVAQARAAVDAAGVPRLVVNAWVALALARQGLAREVNVEAAPGSEARAAAVEALRSLVRSLAAHGAAGATIGTPDDPRAAPTPERLNARPGEAFPSVSRACLSCGQGFEVNRAHTRAHVYCSPACRSRAFRRARKSA